MSEASNRPMSEAEFKTMLEDLAAEELFRLLGTRGHVIDGVQWPDRERRGVKGSKGNGEKTVDLTFREDGHLVAVDVIELHVSRRHARQSVEMSRIVYDLERELRRRVRE